MTTPIDMVKTRLMLQRESKRAGSYKSGLHCAYQVHDLPFFLLSVVLYLMYFCLVLCLVSKCILDMQIELYASD